MTSNTQPVVHELKTWPQYWDDLLSGRKTFEVRKNDRLFGTGDVLHLKEWSPTGGYSGREMKKVVTYVMAGGQWGLSENIVVMGIRDEQPPAVGGEDLQDQVRRHIKDHELFDWEEALTNEEMTYLENLMLTFMPIVPPGSVGYEALMRAYPPPSDVQEAAKELLGRAATLVGNPGTNISSSTDLACDSWQSDYAKFLACHATAVNNKNV